MNKQFLNVRLTNPKLYKQLGFLNLRGTGQGYKSRVNVFYKIVDNSLILQLRNDKIKGTHLEDLELFLNESFENDPDTPENIYKLISGEIISFNQVYLP